ncbi:hypothetical protein VTL71DRAFT_12694 [Oculimacula yallundae]|uniref:Uncharacterized protein n=1 Tax=Oculimacula yallundae TaxID=86028 RepID=A0ABR4CNS3_9HELO
MAPTQSLDAYLVLAIICLLYNLSLLWTLLSYILSFGFFVTCVVFALYAVQGICISFGLGITGTVLGRDHLMPGNDVRRHGDVSRGRRRRVRVETEEERRNRHLRVRARREVSTLVFLYLDYASTYKASSSRASSDTNQKLHHNLKMLTCLLISCILTIWLFVTLFITLFIPGGFIFTFLCLISFTVFLAIFILFYKFFWAIIWVIKTVACAPLIAYWYLTGAEERNTEWERQRRVSVRRRHSLEVEARRQQVRRAWVEGY